MRVEILKAVNVLSNSLIEMNYELNSRVRVTLASEAAIRFLRDQVNASIQSALKLLDGVNLTTLNLAEMSLLGFKYFEASEGDIMMIPKWMTPLLKSGEVYTNNLGDTITIVDDGAMPFSSFKAETYLTFGNKLIKED